MQMCTRTRLRRKTLFSSNVESTDLKKRTIRSAGITVLSQAVGFAVQTIGTFVLARLVTPVDFGLVTMVTAISVLLQNLGENGFTEAVLQQDKVSHDQLSTLFWINVGLNSFLTLLFIVSCPAIAWFYSEPRLLEIGMVISATILMGALPIQHLALLKRNLQFFRTSLNDFVAVISSTILAVFLAWSGWGYWSIVARRLAAAFVNAVGGWLLCPWTPGAPRNIGLSKPLLRFACNTYGNFSLTYLSRNLDTILIGKFFGPRSLGLYDRAYHISMILPGQLSSSLTSVAVASLSKVRHDPERYRLAYMRMLSLIAFIALPLSAILTLNAKDFVLVLLGTQWETAGDIFAAFAPSIGIMVIYGTNGWLHLSLGKADRWFRWGIVRMLSASTAIILGLMFGPLGVAVSYSVFIFVTVIPALLYAGAPAGLRFSFFFEVLWKYVVATVFAAITCWFLFSSITPIVALVQDVCAVLRIISSSLVCISIYIIALICLFRSTGPLGLLFDVVHEIMPRR